jgi:hypothetical protein
MVLAIGLFVYCLVTSQLTVPAVLNAIVAIGLTINLLVKTVIRFHTKAGPVVVRLASRVRADVRLSTRPLTERDLSA